MPARDDAEGNRGPIERDGSSDQVAGLRRTVEAYRRLLEGARDAIWRTDSSGRLDFVNGAMEQLVGRPAAELLGTPLSRCFSPRAAVQLQEGIRETLASTPSGSVWASELEYLHADGRSIPAEVRLAVELDSKGLVEALRGVSRGCAERMQAEEALRRNDELWAVFMRHSPIYVYIKAVTPTESRVIRASENYRDMIGIPGSLMVGKTMEELFPPEMAAKFTADDWRVVSSGEVLSLDEDLENRSYVSVKFPIVLGDRTLLAGYTIDITDRKRTEQALRESELRYAQLAEQSGTVAWEVDAEGVYTYVSHVSESVWGYRAEELVGRTRFYDLHPEAGREEFRRACFEVFRARGLIKGLVNPVQTKSGAVVWVSTEGLPLLKDDGSLRGYRGSDTDITARKRAEEDAARFESQLRQAQKMESVGRLAGGVAHDFNNMLGAILGHAELALSGLPPDSPIRANLVEIQKAGIRSANLTRQLLAFARKQTVAPKVLDLNDALAGMLGMLQRLIGENIELSLQPYAGLWQVKVDPSQIDQIATNLCVNARDSIAGVGRIAIETDNWRLDDDAAARTGRSPGDYVRLSVSDTGSGMDETVLSRVFEPFFTTKEPGEGTGLGLATVYGIVEQNRGFIDVRSKPGAGSRFEIHLPRHTGEPCQTSGDTGSPVVHQGRETILLVEDEPSILEVTRTMLERQGYVVMTANTPGEAIRVATEHPGEIQLLITDVVMPEMNGRDLASRLLSQHPGLKRLFMSGYTADVIAHHGVLDDGVRFLQKPFSMQELAAKVREALERG